MQHVICPGSFDPIHNGHVDIITRAVRIFGKVTVAVAHNSAKNYRFTLEERLEMVCETFSYVDGITVEAMPTDMLLADYVRSKGSVLLVKGVRNTNDWEYEAPMATMNRHIAKVETCFFASDPKHGHLSSTIVREVASYNGDVSTFVPRAVQKALTEGK